MIRSKNLILQHEGVVTIAVGRSCKETQWKNREMTWSALVEKLSRTTRTRETYAEYRALDSLTQNEIKDVGGFVGGTLREGRRKADSLVWRQLVTLDADHLQEDIWPIVEAHFEFACAAYSTHKHCPKAPRIRLVIPLSRPVSPEEYGAVARRIASIFGIDLFDDTTYEPHRLMYWPSTSEDGEFVFHYLDKPWADPAVYLASYADWTDPTQWPESTRQQSARRRLADRAGDPLQKDGVVGAFCRAYTVAEAIEKFLPDVYVLAGEGRYTYSEGTTSGGLVLYDQDKFCYSHHGTDPLSGKLVNAFDLVRIHRFGNLDDNVREGTAMGKHPSFKAMQEFALADDEVRVSLAKYDFGAEDAAWVKQLTFNKKGELENTIRNLELILLHDPALQGIAYNGFNQTVCVKGEAPWKRHSDTWSDADDAALRGYLESAYGLYAVSKTHDAFSMVTQKRYFHPVRDFLHSLPPWDGLQRVDRLLVDYLGAEDSALTREVTRKTLVAAISRVMQPGIKFDTMLVLVGPQGCGKSTLFNRLARGWFSDNLTVHDMKDKAAVEKLQGYWIIESGELAGLRKAEEEMVKNFLSRETDVVRFAYERRPANLPRQCIVVGSTNQAYGFLRDQTGNRRFWPVYVQKVPFAQSSWTLTDSTVVQIWAEALSLYHAGETLILSPANEKLAALAQKDSLVADERVFLVEAFLNKVLPLNWHELTLKDRLAFLDNDFQQEPLKEGIVRDRVCGLEVWCECFQRRAADYDHARQREIQGILLQLPGWLPHEGNQRGLLRFSLYGLKRAFVRA